LPAAADRPWRERRALQAPGIRPDRRRHARARPAGDRPESRLSFNAITEAFFARHLGGRCEPIGDDLAGSSLQVREGIDGIAGLGEAMAERVGRGSAGTPA
jgi:hypothetical protein